MTPTTIAARAVEYLYFRGLLSSRFVARLASATSQARAFDPCLVRVAIETLLDDCLLDELPMSLLPMSFFERATHDGLRHDLLVTSPADGFVTLQNVDALVDCLRSIASISKTRAGEQAGGAA